MSELTQDEINAILANISVDDAQITKDTTSMKMSLTRTGKASWKKGLSTPAEVIEKLKGHVPYNKGKTGLQVAHNKGKTGLQVAHNKGHSIYVYASPLGDFQCFADLKTAHPEYSNAGLRSFCKFNKHGFSKRLKDV